MSNWDSIAIPQNSKRVSRWVRGITSLMLEKEKQGCKLFIGTIRFNYIPGFVLSGGLVDSSRVEARLEHFYKELCGRGMRKRKTPGIGCIVIIFELDHKGAHAHFCLAYEIDRLEHKYAGNFKSYWERDAGKLFGGVYKGGKDLINSVWIGDWDGTDTWVKYCTKRGEASLGGVLYYGSVNKGDLS